MRWTNGKLLALFLVSIGSLLFVAMGIAFAQKPDYWAAGGQWAGAIGSVLAAMAAIWIALEGWKRAETHAARVELEQREREDRAFASQFGMWIERVESLGEDEESVWHFDLMYRNSGPQPCYKVETFVNFERSHNRYKVPDYRESSEFIGPTGGPARSTATAKRSLQEHLLIYVRLHECNSYVADLIEEVMPDHPLSENERVSLALAGFIEAAEITTFFTDGAGIRWVRRPDGQLFKRQSNDEELRFAQDRYFELRVKEARGKQGDE